MMFILAEPPAIPDFVPEFKANGGIVYTVPQVAARLQCSKDHVYDLITSGALAAKRDGRRWFIAPIDLNTYIMHRPAGAKVITIRRERQSRKTG